jgi:hypothetical protein
MSTKGHPSMHCTGLDKIVGIGVTDGRNIPNMPAGIDFFMGVKEGWGYLIIHNQRGKIIYEGLQQVGDIKEILEKDGEKDLSDEQTCHWLVISYKNSIGYTGQEAAAAYIFGVPVMTELSNTPWKPEPR